MITIKPKEKKVKSEEKPMQRYLIGNGLLPMQNLIEVMILVDTKNPNAQLNATSISDNNGGRIQLNDPTVPKPDFTKIVPNK